MTEFNYHKAGVLVRQLKQICMQRGFLWGKGQRLKMNTCGEVKATGVDEGDEVSHS